METPRRIRREIHESAWESYEKMSPAPGGFAQLRNALSALYAVEPNPDTNAIKKIKAQTVIGCSEYEQFYTVHILNSAQP